MRILKIKQLKRKIERQTTIVKISEASFQGKVRLYSKAVGTDLHRKAYNLKEKSRQIWWKDLDIKVQLEQDLKKELRLLVKSLEEAE